VRSDAEAFVALRKAIPLCFSSAVVGELSCFDETFASRLFNLVGAFVLDGLRLAGALGFFELLGSTASASALVFSFKFPKFSPKFVTLFL
jgi:hypothetical protein